MKIIQISKRLSNWEVGNSRGHERLVNLPINLKDLLFNNQIDVYFTDKKEKDQSFLLTYFPKRNWVKKLGPYYNKYNLQVGDEIVLETILTQLKAVKEGQQKYMSISERNE